MKGIYRFLYAIGLIALFPICVAAVCIFGFNYVRWGRLTDFQVMHDGDTIAGTNYRIIKANGNFILRNQGTGTEKKITHSGISDIVERAEYEVLTHKGTPYLITREENAGSGSGDDYDVLNLSNDPPHAFVWDNLSNSFHFACTYPRLEEDRLQFESSEHCDMFPFVTTPISSFYMPLP